MSKWLKIGVVGKWLDLWRGEEGGMEIEGGEEHGEDDGEDE